MNIQVSLNGERSSVVSKSVSLLISISPYQCDTRVPETHVIRSHLTTVNLRFILTEPELVIVGTVEKLTQMFR